MTFMPATSGELILCPWPNCHSLQFGTDETVTLSLLPARRQAAGFRCNLPARCLDARGFSYQLELRRRGCLRPG
jgi:hypothetical protein